ncbi:PKD domain-containing protein [Streptomyces subrutilus]|uniref:PKD domain-containing protein n=1 Tax=Streptomyces subrutilus TaxID=36818 RepID=A0A1E5Q0S8_9ACTN|nr:PKD domain-containing protein [Streptomyces subrutilus]OEJ35336.1 hypothetical protein BGK67_32200 [Streptomyces subrutilus]
MGSRRHHGEGDGRSGGRWPTGLTYHYDFGDGTAPVVTKATTAEHVYSSPCACVAKVTAVNGVGEKVSSFDQPAKVTAPGPLTTAFTVTPLLPTSSDPFTRRAPLTVSVDTDDTAAPWPVTSTDVDFGDGTQGTSTTWATSSTPTRCPAPTT